MRCPNGKAHGSHIVGILETPNQVVGVRILEISRRIRPRVHRHTPFGARNAGVTQLAMSG